MLLFLQKRIRLPIFTGLFHYIRMVFCANTRFLTALKTDSPSMVRASRHNIFVYTIRLWTKPLVFHGSDFRQVLMFWQLLCIFHPTNTITRNVADGTNCQNIFFPAHRTCYSREIPFPKIRNLIITKSGRFQF